MEGLKAEVDRLRAENATLKTENSSLKTENVRLAAKLNVMEKSFADLMGKFGAARAEAAAAAAASGSTGSGQAPLLGAGSGGGNGAQTPPSGLSSLFNKKDKGKTVKHRSKEGGRFGTVGPSSTAMADTFGTAPQRSHSMISEDESTRRRSHTVDSRQLSGQPPLTGRGSSSVISPRDVEAGVLHKAWGVALRDHFDSGVTVPSAVSQLVSHIKQFVLHCDEAPDGKKPVLFAGLTGKEDARLRGLLEFGDGVPPGTPVDASCELLLSFLNSLPDPVIGPEAAQLLAEAAGFTDPDYQLQAVRSVIQSALPYNHRVLLQLLVSILSRMKDAAMDLECALEALSGVLFPTAFQPPPPATRKALLALVASNSDTFPTSNVGVQYMVEKSSHGKMLVKSAEPAAVLALLTHRFTQEPRTWAALLALHARWSGPRELVAELSAQHTRFVQQQAAAQAQPPGTWLQAARLHVLFVAQGLLELCPELFMAEAAWQEVRRASRAWQKECAADGGEPERKLRKWMKAAHKRVTGAHAELQTSLEQLLQLRQEGPGLDFAALVKEVDPKAVAEQMCLIDSVFFRCVPKSELLLCDALSSASVETTAPNWYRMIQSFNAVSQWVVSVVLSASLPSQRAEYIVFFLKIADHLQNVLANYNASYAVISALSDASVERLKLTWSRVSQSFLALHGRLQEVWSVSRNFARYREELHRAKALPPAIPYCGLLSKDLFAVQENNRSDVVESPAGGGSHVNVDKLRLLWDKMEPFVRLQHGPDYARLTRLPAVQCFLLRLGDRSLGGYPFLDPATYKAVSLALEKKAVIAAE